MSLSRQYDAVMTPCECEVAQSCSTLCDSVDYSLPGSSILGIFQARELEWVAISFSIISPKHLCPGKGLERYTSWGCYWSSPSHSSNPGSHPHLQMSGFMASTVTLASLLLVFPPNTPQILKFPFLSSFFLKKCIYLATLGLSHSV